MVLDLVILLVVGLMPLTQAIAYLQYTSWLPAELPAACSAALTADLDCDSGVNGLLTGCYHPESVLNNLCTTDCNTALNKYESSVVSACGAHTYASNTSQGDVPVSTIPQLLRYYYNYTCLTSADGAGFCNVIFANEIGINANQSNLKSPDVQGGGNLTCDDCSLQSLQFLAGSPFFNNDDTKVAYSSLTSSCHATGYPLSTSTFTFQPSTTAATQTSSALPTSSTCSGKTYDIQAGDTCASISKTQEIGTIWLLLDNNLAAYCAKFPTSGSLCIDHQCSTYTVQANDTCRSIASSHQVTYAQMLSWNPNFDLLCSNINRTVGLEICVSSPDGNSASPSSTTITTGLPSSSTTTKAPVPTNAANGSTTDCGQWYEAVPGDYCNLITVRFGISIADFLILNPEVNANCTNLYTEESYCVQPVGDISNYPGAPGHISVSPSTTAVPYSSLPTATYIPPLYVPYNVSYANGTSRLCASYVDGTDYNAIDLSNTFYSDACSFVAAQWSISLEQLYLWNPSLGDTSQSSCALSNNTLYCVQDYIEATTTVTAPPPPPTASSAVNCTQYGFAGQDVPCDELLSVWNITLAYFQALNPSIGADCSGLSENVYYCIQAAGDIPITTASTSPASSTTTMTSVIPPGPTQSGIPAECNAYYLVQKDDTCDTVEAKFGITDAQFHSWNPAVAADCLSGFWAEEAYCVGVSTDSGSTTIGTTSSSTVATSSSTRISSVTPPGPTQSGIPSNCNAYYVVQAGDTCDTIEAKFGITNKQFHAWNPAVSSDCLDGFWADEAYCVGVSS